MISNESFIHWEEDGEEGVEVEEDGREDGVEDDDDDDDERVLLNGWKEEDKARIQIWRMSF